MNPEDSLTAVYIGIAYNNLTVKSARTHKSRIENIGSVGCGNKDYTFICTETVHFNKQLVKSLLTLIVAAAKTCASLATYGVNLINKDDTRRVFLCLIKEVTNTGRTDTDKHLNKV